ncbi:hypothetical protein CPC08DRAFT_592449, partial [Agrocybe pediades]
QYEAFMALREDTKVWSERWGGVTIWRDSLEVLFSRAYHLGEEKTKAYIERLWTHELHGKQILRQLRTFEGILPSSKGITNILWSYQQELVITLVQGITIIQTKLPFLR